jgi:uncharacterized protein YjdB
MTFKHKLSVRLALMREIAMAVPAALILACASGDGAFAPGHTLLADAAPSDIVFAEDFESGALSAWQDGVNATRHRVVTDSAFARSGGRYLDVTYPAGGDGGWLTRFFMPGYDSLYVSYYVRFPLNWQGSTKLIAFYGSRTDNQWSAFGKGGVCPNGTDFFAAMLVTDPVGSPGPTRFYSYYPAMAREPNGVTCWGRFGDGTETYAPLAMSRGDWHHVEYWVKLNTPGQANAIQTFWIDGVQRGSWSGLSFRSSSILALNSVQLTFSTGAAPQTQHLYVDDLVVRTTQPGSPGSQPPPVTAPGDVNDLAVVGATDTSVTLSFTEVTDGAGQPASYDVRSAAGTLSWPSAPSVSSGSCATPVSGSVVGATRTCTALGLTAATAYQFQLVAFRGTLNVNAVFGALSNIASGSTMLAPVASVVVSPATVSQLAATTQQLGAVLKDAKGTVLTGRTVIWTSSNPAVATVNDNGVATSVAPGTATITATSEGVSGSSDITVTSGKPGSASDLTVVETTDSSVTLSFTEVGDGAGAPASYDVRVAAGTLSWGSAASVARGSCASPLTGSAVGAPRTCTVLGLAASTSYQFQLVAFRGTLNVNAVFGVLSSVATGATSAKPVTPVPVASVVVTPAVVSQFAGTTQQFSAVLKDAAGNVVTDRSISWTSSNPAVASVDGNGLESSLAVGTATITATSEGISGNAATTVTATSPARVSNLAVIAKTGSSVTLSFTEVADGAGGPASYNVRFAAGALSWGSAASVTQGTCATPMSGTIVGVTRTCTVLGLAPGTAYQFQVVAFRGTLNVNAVFSGLSNVASGTTAASIAPVASVTVSPSSLSLALAGTQTLTATLRDASGTILTGRSVTWASSAPLVASVSGSGVVSGLLAGLATITATSEGISGTAAVTITVGGGGASREPAGFRVFNDQPWSLMTGNGWKYLRRTSTKDDGIVVDPTSPRSAADVLRIVFTTNMIHDTEPSVHWIGLGGLREIYTSWWMKVSPNWQCSAAGCGKITFLMTNVGGQVYTNLYNSAAGRGAPYRVGVNTEWSPYGQKIWMPNVTTTPVNPGEWHRIEVYYRWETASGAANGIIRWWVDGVLNGDYTNVQYPSGSFIEYQYAPTLQNPPTTEQYMYIDHTYVSVP